MSDATTIATGLCGFIREQIAGPGVDVQPGTSLQQLGFDSFSMLELVLFLERRYGVTLPEHELTRENLFSPQTLADCASRYAVN